MPADAELLAHARTRVGKVLCRKYRIDHVLGVGGMAAVYSATHRNGRRVAVKLLHPELSIREEIRRRFLREGHAASAVNHPGVVVVLDDDVAEDGAAFLVLELLDGQTAEEIWEQNGRRLPEKTVMAIGRELCDVLAAAHRAGVVHRDIKPANIFVTREGRLKVLDFGIARVRDVAASTATQTGAVFGTPAFMAPEQASGRVSLVDHQTDVWAVGATLFTLLAGSTVHEGESAQHLAMLSATRPARSLAAVMPEARSELVAVVDRALAFEKPARWPTTEAMRAAIVEASGAMFGEAMPPIASLSETLKVGAAAPEESGRALPAEPWSDVALSAGNGLGNTTSAPVSGSAPTHRARGPILTRARDSVGALFGLGLAATEVASPPPMTSARSRPSSVIALAAVGAIAVMALGAVAFRVGGRGASPAAVDAAASRVVEPPVSVEPSAVLTVSASGEPDAGVLLAPTAAQAASSAPVRAGRPPPRPASPPRAAGPTASAAPPKAKCDSPSFVDATGKTLWKAECL